MSALHQYQHLGHGRWRCHSCEQDIRNNDCRHNVERLAAVFTAVRIPAPPLTFAERQIVRRFDRAADGCCELCEGVGEVQARLPHMARWRLISCPTCFPAVER